MLWLGWLVACPCLEPCGLPEPIRSPVAPVPAAPVCDAAAFAVGVDIGHSPQDPGATSARGRPEHAFNRDMAERIVATLHRGGFAGSFLIDPAVQSLTLTDRPRAAAAGGASAFLSIHHDSVQGGYLEKWTHEDRERHHTERFAGFSLWVSQDGPRTDDNRTLGLAIGSALLAAGHRPTLHHAEDIEGERRELIDPDVGLYRRDTLAVLRVATVPAVLVETGVIVNREEELRLRDPAAQQVFADALVAGVRAYCALTPGRAPTP